MYLLLVWKFICDMIFFVGYFEIGGFYVYFLVEIMCLLDFFRYEYFF